MSGDAKPDDVLPLVMRLLRGERLAVAACLNDVEDRRPAAQQRSRELLASLSQTQATGRAHRIGITGPPGVGKSSLVAALARTFRGGQRTVGVLAVDPSSARSGGALLGDRVRIASDGLDAGLFIRSLATRGELGGLARAAAAETLLMSAAFDVVLLETVGIGQSEIDVREVVDTLVFVVQPGAGDTLQHLKAGIMEVPDLFVVNKADVGPVAERARSDLKTALQSLAQAGIVEGSPPGVLSTSARDGTGIAELVAQLDARRDAALAAGTLTLARRGRAVARAVREFSRRYGELGVERGGGPDAVRRAVEARLAGEDVASVVLALDPFGGGP